MEIDVVRAVAHFVVLLGFLYLAFDERAAGRYCRAWMWAALAAERLAFLVLLVIDVSRSGTVWMEWRANLTPFILLVSIALTIYIANRIRAKRQLRKEIAPLLHVATSGEA